MLVYVRQSRDCGRVSLCACTRVTVDELVYVCLSKYYFMRNSIGEYMYVGARLTC